MLIRDLILKKDLLYSYIVNINDYLDNNNKLSKEEYRSLINILNNYRIDYEGCISNIISLSCNEMVEVESGKKLSLSKLILLKDSLSTKIQNIDSIIKKSNITFDVLGELLTIKKNTQEELLYISTLVNKFIWGHSDN